MPSGFEWKAYQYEPTKAGAIIACVLFGLVTLTCAFQFIVALKRVKNGRSKSQVLTVIPFIIGGVFEIIGYLGRILSLENANKLGPYIIQSLLLLVAPALFAASIYMALGRIILDLKADHYSIIPLKWLTMVFVTGDVFSFFLQGAGGGVQASATLKTFQIGGKLIIAGLFVQIAFFGFFIIVMGVFQMRINREPTPTSMNTRFIPSRLRNWQMVIITLFVCSALIFIRSVVRAIEYIQGNDGYIISHEIYLYMLDGLLMFLQMIVYCLQDVGRFFSHYERRKTLIGADPLVFTDSEKDQCE